jgi:hypothetical protein
VFGALHHSVELSGIPTAAIWRNARQVWRIALRFWKFQTAFNTSFNLRRKPNPEPSSFKSDIGNFTSPTCDVLPLTIKASDAGRGVGNTLSLYLIFCGTSLAACWGHGNRP